MMPNKLLQPTPAGVGSSAAAGHVVDPAWLNFWTAGDIRPSPPT